MLNILSRKKTLDEKVYNELLETLKKKHNFKEEQISSLVMNLHEKE
jgi:predicted nucleic acid-binding protein